MIFADNVDIEILTTGSPTSPPYVLMLEWITDISRWYSNLYPLNIIPQEPRSII